MQPETKFARLGEDRIAYFVTGEGPVDLVLTPGMFGSMDVEWDDPEFGTFFRRLAAFSRLIRYDRRGSGSSDPIRPDAFPPWESSAEELRAVMDAAGSERAVVFAGSDSGGPAMLFCATWPERVSGLVLYHVAAKFVAEDDYPIGLPRPVADAIVTRMAAGWGTEELVRQAVPSRAEDERFRRWFARYMRQMATPRSAEAFLRDMMQSDSRALLPSLRLPVLIVNRSESMLVPFEQARYLAEHIEGATLVELPGSDGPPFWEGSDLFVASVRDFLARVQPSVPHAARRSRAMATLLFTDIESSTERATDLGDRGWRDLLDVHDGLAERRVREFEGRLVKSTGDGILATFDGPGRGMLCAWELQTDLRRVGLPIRSGLHTGEVELRGDDVGGVAVHIAARVMAAAGAGEILVSRTVRDLVVGSDFALEDRGLHALKGVEGEWQLFALSGAG